MRRGSLRCVVATSSLDLGVDFSPVDRVLQIGSPKGVARLLQRAGRSGHQPGAVSRVTCVPTNALELLEVAAVRDGMRDGRDRGARARGAAARRARAARRDGGAGRRLRADGAARRGAGTDRVRGAHGRGVGVDARLSCTRVARRSPRTPSMRVSCGTARAVRGARTPRSRGGTGCRSARSLAMRRSSCSYLRGGVARLGGGVVHHALVARRSVLLRGKPLELVRVRDMKAWVRRAPTCEGSDPAVDGKPDAAVGRARGHAAAAARRSGGRRVPRSRSWRRCGRCSRCSASGRRSRKQDELLIERVKIARRMASLRLSRSRGGSCTRGWRRCWRTGCRGFAPITFSMSSNDWGFELLSSERAAAGGGARGGAPVSREPGRRHPGVAERDRDGEAAVPGDRAGDGAGVSRVSALGQDGAAAAGVERVVLRRVQAIRPATTCCWTRRTARCSSGSSSGAGSARTLQRLAACAGDGDVAPKRFTPLAFPLLVDRTQNKRVEREAGRPDQADAARAGAGGGMT